MAEAKFKVGQVVMHDRQGKRSLPALILEVVTPDDVSEGFYYRTDRQNCFAESMFRALTPEEAGSGRLTLEVYQHDWIPGFAAFHSDGDRTDGATKHVVLNLGSLLSAVQSGDLDKRDLPYMIAESLMHETVHALEEWAGIEFSEDRVEDLLTKYREKYSRATVWKYTGEEPTIAI